MTERSREQQFDDVEQEYTLDEDKEVIRANRETYKESKNFSDLADSPGGRLLIKSLKDEISKSLQLLIETRNGRYVSDIESNLNLLTKLIRAKKQTEAIAKWLDSLE